MENVEYTSTNLMKKIPPSFGDDELEAVDRVSARF
jgi:hypothetical protein